MLGNIHFSDVKQEGDEKKGCFFLDLRFFSFRAKYWFTRFLRFKFKSFILGFPLHPERFGSDGNIGSTLSTVGFAVDSNLFVYVGDSKLHKVNVYFNSK
jgi:hypothetical protein